MATNQPLSEGIQLSLTWIIELINKTVLPSSDDLLSKTRYISTKNLLHNMDQILLRCKFCKSSPPKCFRSWLISLGCVLVHLKDILRLLTMHFDKLHAIYFQAFEQTEVMIYLMLFILEYSVRFYWLIVNAI